MKRSVHSYILLLGLLLLPCGCENKPDNPTEEFIPALAVTPLNLSFGQEGGTVSISIVSNTTWNVSSSASWCTSPIQISKGDATININAEANDVEEERSATITIRATDVDDITVSVLQDAMEPEPVDSSKLDYIAPDSTGMSSDATSLASKMFLGWNLGNTLEATGGETSWGNPMASNELMVAVKAAGFNAIRIPCAWNRYLEDQTTYKIKDSWLDRVNEVVDYCVDNDLYAILNIHWDGGWMENNCTPEKEEEVGEKLAAIWKQIAIQFRDYDEHLLFAGSNEPNADTQEQVDVLAAHMQTFVDVVRATGGRNSYRNLIVQAPFTDIDRADQYMTMPTDTVDNRLFAEVHYYTPWQFCGLEEDASWGDVFYFWGEPYHLEGAEGRYPDWDCEEDYMENQFQKMKSKFVDTGIPLILGEFGAMKRDFPGNDLWQETHDESRAYFFENVAERAKNNGLVPFFWDNGSGIFDRNTNTINEEGDYNGLIQGATDGSYPF